MLDATAGPDGADPASAHAQPPNAFKKLGKSIKGLRVGLLSHFWEEDLSVRPEIIKAVEQAAALHFQARGVLWNRPVLRQFRIGMTLRLLLQKLNFLTCIAEI